MNRFSNREFFMAFALIAIMFFGVGYLISGGNKEADFSAKAVSTEELNLIQENALQLNERVANYHNILQAILNDLNSIPDSLKHQNVKNVIQFLTKPKS